MKKKENRRGGIVLGVLGMLGCLLLFAYFALMALANFGRETKPVMGSFSVFMRIVSLFSAWKVAKYTVAKKPLLVLCVNCINSAAWQNALVSFAMIQQRWPPRSSKRKKFLTPSFGPCANTNSLQSSA